MAIFSRHKRCAHCDRDLPRKELIRVDPEPRPDGPSPDTRPYCDVCLEGELIAQLPAYRGRCLAVEPLGGRNNGYAFMTLEQLPGFEWSRDYVQDVKDLLPKEGGKCLRCGREAHFNLVDPSVYFGDPYASRLSPEEVRHARQLCGRCLATELVYLIRALPVPPTDIQLPTGNDDAVWSSQQY